MSAAEWPRERSQRTSPAGAAALPRMAWTPVGPRPAGLPLEPLRALAAEEPVEVTVTGGSMAPAIPAGARVSVRPARLYLPGDVVAFLGRDRLLRVHRLLGPCPTLRGLRLLTRGDAAPARDPAVAPADLLGRVEAVDGAPLAVRPAARLRALASLARQLRDRAFDGGRRPRAARGGVCGGRT